MTLPVSGPISMNQVNVELGLAGTTNISLNQSNVRNLFGRPSGTISLSDGRGKTSTIYLTIASNTTRYNIFLSAGSPSVPTNVQVTVNSGVIVGSVTGGTDYAMYTGAGWAAGSTITIINNGYIQGIGGNGGNGGSSFEPYTGGNGGSGGAAILLSWPVNIGNNGYIYGGGGGGGGGGLGYTTDVLGGGGGGGGQSSLTNSAGGSGGAIFTGTAGSSGGSGTVSAAGGGGAGGNTANNGGAGGTVGVAGGAGGNGTSGYPGGAGGAAGKAINLNGYYVGWLYGNNSTQVKGAVS